MADMEKDFENLDELEKYDEDESLVELTDEDGGKHLFCHLGTIEHKGKYYACFSPAEDEDSDEVIILEVGGEGEDDEAALYPVEDEALLDEIFQAFCEYFDEEELADEAMEMEGCGCDDDCDCEDCDDDCDDDCDCGHHHHRKD